MAMPLRWIKCQGDVWCKLNSVNLQHAHFNDRGGIYVIWHGGEQPATVYVGQTGDLRERLRAHRNDGRIQEYGSLGLYVTWATVDPGSLDGVERYLGERLKPRVATNFRDVQRIEAQLPW